MAKLLEMVFRNTSGKEVTLSLADPKDTLTDSQVKPVMQSMVDKGLFTSKSGDLVQIVEARLRSRDSVKLS